MRKSCQRVLKASDVHFRTTTIVPVAVLRRICYRRFPLSPHRPAAVVYAGVATYKGCVEGRDGMVCCPTRWNISPLRQQKILHSNELGVGRLGIKDKEEVLIFPILSRWTIQRSSSWATISSSITVSWAYRAQWRIGGLGRDKRLQIGQKLFCKC